MNIQKSDLDVTHIQRHRNGISGIGFYAVYFDWKDDSGTVRHMMATVMDLDNHDEELAEKGEFYNPPTAVVDRRDPEACWRGDYFDPALRQIIAEDVDRKYGPLPVE